MLIIKFEKMREDPELKERVTRHIKEGLIFVYPTDTIYGLGCNALMPQSVKRIRDIKRTEHPFSVIAPSIAWIKENLIIKHSQYLEKFPGPYTLIFDKKDPDFLKWVSHTQTLGVRIPNHHFTKFIQKTGVPFITTSVNLTGQPPVHNIKDIPQDILNQIDVVIDAGPLENPPSRVIDLTGKEPLVLRN